MRSGRLPAQDYMRTLTARADALKDLNALILLDSARALDADLLKEAVRRADLLLVHLADPEALARRLSRCESSGS